jgi:hypothetical protein
MIANELDPGAQPSVDAVCNDGGARDDNTNVHTDAFICNEIYSGSDGDTLIQVDKRAFMRNKYVRAGIWFSLVSEIKYSRRPPSSWVFTPEITNLSITCEGTFKPRCKNQETIAITETAFNNNCRIYHYARPRRLTRYSVSTIFGWQHVCDPNSPPSTQVLAMPPFNG